MPQGIISIKSPTSGKIYQLQWGSSTPPTDADIDDFLSHVDKPEVKAPTPPPVSNPTPRTFQTMSDNPEENKPSWFNKVMGGIHESGMDTPENLAVTALTGGAGSTRGSMLKAVTPIVQKAMTVAKAAIPASFSASGLVDAIKNPDQRVSGLVQAALGALGTRSALREIPSGPFSTQNDDSIYAEVPKSPVEAPKVDVGTQIPTVPKGLQEVAPVKPKVKIGLDGQPKLLNPNKDTISSVVGQGYIPKIEQDGSVTLKKVKDIGSPIKNVTPINNDIQESTGAPPTPPPPNNETLTAPEPIKPSKPPKEPPNKALVVATDLANSARNIKTAYDISAPGRQGINLIGTKNWWTAYKPMLESMKSEANYNAHKLSIEEHPNYELSQEGGLSLSDLGDKREEQFAGTMADKVPGVKASARAYTAYLNDLRFNTFNDYLDKFQKAGVDLTNPANSGQLKQVTRYINNVTGRGSLGPLESSGKTLNAALFSPRLMSARVQNFGDVLRGYSNLPKPLRMEAWKNLISMGGIIGTTLGVAKAAGADVSTDPSSSDFGKIKVGNTRIDPWGGQQQYAVLAYRMATGKSTNIAGKTQSLDSNKYGASSRADALLHFLRSKESPIAGFITNQLVGKDFVGRPLDTGIHNSFDPNSKTIMGNKQLEDLVTPMMLSDLADVLKDNPSHTPLILPGLIGAGVQTMDTSPFPKFGPAKLR